MSYEEEIVNKNDAEDHGEDSGSPQLHLSDEEWRTKLTPEQYRILREKGTEQPGSGKYYHFKNEGVFLCAACGQELFDSGTKYDSGSGWPSFWEPIRENAIDGHLDTSHFMRRTEVVCGRCGSHLGHVFEDGPKPSGLRYCINSMSLDFKPKGKG